MLALRPPLSSECAVITRVSRRLLRNRDVAPYTAFPTLIPLLLLFHFHRRAPTEVSVSFPEIPEAYPRNWITFCAEGSVESIEGFLGGAGKPLVALLSIRGALQVGYPQFVQMISTA